MLGVRHVLCSNRRKTDNKTSFISINLTIQFLYPTMDIMEGQEILVWGGEPDILENIHVCLERFDSSTTDWHFKTVETLDASLIHQSSLQKSILILDEARVPAALHGELLHSTAPLVLIVSDDSRAQPFLHARHDTTMRLVWRDHHMLASQIAEAVLSIRRNFSREEHYIAVQQEIGSRFQNLLKALPDIVYILDEKGRFAFLNDAVRDLGYEPQELVGKHFSEILHEEDRTRVSREAVLAQIRAQDAFPETPPKLFDERRSGLRMTRDLEVRIPNKATGQLVYGLVNAYGESNPVSLEGVSESFHGPVTMGIIHDITAVKLYQKSLEENLAAKELLLREIHHRVKNNLQVIASLTHLREMEVDDQKTREVLAGLIAQIKSMAMVHEALYQTENLQGVSAKEYFERFASFMEQTYSYIGSPISLEVCAQDCLVEVEQLSYLAMIATELVSNAYKHAFPDNRSGFIRISFELVGEESVMSVEDNGIGAQAGSALNDGLGLEIVHALARQLGAEIRQEAVSGTKITLRMDRHGLD